MKGNLQAFTAEDLHKVIFKAHVVGNRARRKFINALLLMATSRPYLNLGFGSIEQYVEKNFRYSKSQTCEFLSVAKALCELKKLDQAFQEGELTWSLSLIHI